MKADDIDPRFFVSTKEQRDIAARVADEEPQEICAGVYLGSRSCVVDKSAHLQQLGVKSIVMCCDRAADEPKLFSYFVVPVNNDTRDSGDQHARHGHADNECCASGAGGGKHSKHQCGDLHLLQWRVSSSASDDKDEWCLVDELCLWIDQQLKVGSVLIHGFDGVTNSAAVCAAFVMWKHRMRFRQAWELIEQKRPVVRLTPQLKRDLEWFDTRLAVSTTKNLRIVPKRNNNSTSGSTSSNNKTDDLITK